MYMIVTYIKRLIAYQRSLALQRCYRRYIDKHRPVVVPLVPALVLAHRQYEALVFRHCWLHFAVIRKCKQKGLFV